MSIENINQKYNHYKTLADRIYTIQNLYRSGFCYFDATKNHQVQEKMFLVFEMFYEMKSILEDLMLTYLDDTSYDVDDNLIKIFYGRNSQFKFDKIQMSETYYCQMFEFLNRTFELLTDISDEILRNKDRLQHEDYATKVFYKIKRAKSKIRDVLEMIV